MKTGWGGLLLAWAVLTACRVPVWHDDGRLWCDAAQQAPHKPRALLNCGVETVKAGAPDVGLTLYRRARAEADRRPDLYERRFTWAAATTNEALLLCNAGRWAEAQRLLRTVREGFPQLPEAQVLAASCTAD